MAVVTVRRAWLRAVLAHARAAESHEVAAGLFGRLMKMDLAARECELAASERQRLVGAVSDHAEWAGEVEELLAARGVSEAVRELAAAAASSG